MIYTGHKAGGELPEISIGAVFERTRFTHFCRAAAFGTRTSLPYSRPECPFGVGFPRSDKRTGALWPEWLERLRSALEQRCSPVLHGIRFQSLRQSTARSALFEVLRARYATRIRWRIVPR